MNKQYENTEPGSKERSVLVYPQMLPLISVHKM